MAWLYLVAAGLLEIFWATCLKLSHGFSVGKFSALTIIGMVASFFLLSQATKILPIGTAYAIWTGIGALGAVVVGILMFKESLTAARIFFAALLLMGIIGLKITSEV
ncbi:MAG: multidrug efflux SMR transporter [Firmicutes bacterium]|nr:multidrug efflux SMR transporter [Bacillota bacterium]